MHAASIGGGGRELTDLPDMGVDRNSVQLVQREEAHAIGHLLTNALHR
jgi:hypothetical protein